MNLVWWVLTVWGGSLLLLAAVLLSAHRRDKRRPPPPEEEEQPPPRGFDPCADPYTLAINRAFNTGEPVFWEQGDPLPDPEGPIRRVPEWWKDDQR